MDVDPVTGKLWNTEDGPEHSDEVNLVEPGFNSGSNVVQGMSYSPANGANKDENDENIGPNNSTAIV
jgi:glucose/arabinose dehydrogenase